MRVIAFDPGITTGWAEALIAENGQIRKLNYGQEKFAVNEMYAFLMNKAPSHLVTEDFEYRNRSRAGLVLYSVELIGIYELYAAQYKIPISRQKASEGKGFFTDPKLKEMHLYLKGERHSRDALRHLLYYLTFKGGSQLWTSIKPASLLESLQPYQQKPL